MEYLFTSERLGFRNWIEEDIPAMHNVSSDPKVMQHFPGTLSLQETTDFVHRMQNHFEKYGYCYFAVDILQTKECIGFIGLCYQTYEAPFTPAVDIGWRLATKFQGMGYATEGAKACLAYAFDTLNIKEVYSVAVHPNTPSIHVMKKIGMEFHSEFNHDALPDSSGLNPCIVYNISQ